MTLAFTGSVVVAPTATMLVVAEPEKVAKTAIDRVHGFAFKTVGSIHSRLSQDRQGDTWGSPSRADWLPVAASPPLPTRITHPDPRHSVHRQYGL